MKGKKGMEAVCRAYILLPKTPIGPLALGNQGEGKVRTEEKKDSKKRKFKK